MHRHTANESGHGQGNVLQLSEWKYDVASHTLFNPEGRLIKLTRLRGDVLEAVLRCAGRPANYDYIRGFVWDDAHEGMNEENELKVVMTKVRGTLETAHTDFEIRTLWGVGYFSTRRVSVISPNLKCCPRCQRPFTLEEADRGDYDGRSDSAAKVASNGEEAAGIDWRKVPRVC